MPLAPGQRSRICVLLRLEPKAKYRGADGEPVGARRRLVLAALLVDMVNGSGQKCAYNGELVEWLKVLSVARGS